jgi:RNA 3'-terminal phosphate cyclase (ATP)
MIEIDGTMHSGSGTLVRHAVMLSALTGQAVHITNCRVRRQNPGLRAQHTWVVEAIRELTNGEAEGNQIGSRELIFRPGINQVRGKYAWDIGSAGSTVLLALAVLPCLAFAPHQVTVQIRGGLFQDFAPSFYHMKHVMFPLLARMGLAADVQMQRPGYVPTGGGVISLSVQPLATRLSPTALDQASPVVRIWGIALSSRLEARSVSQRMATAAEQALTAAGFASTFETLDDDLALQAGAALAAFADREDGSRLGADRAGTPSRRAEDIGKHVARQLLEDIRAGATVDRFAADQIIAFAALAEGESRFLIPGVTEHISAGGWLIEKFLGARLEITDNLMSINGVGFKPVGR